MVICTGMRYNLHEEIIYDYGECPLCMALGELDSVKTQLREAEDGWVKNGD